MKRTQIYIPEETYQESLMVADRLDTSVAEVYRNYIKNGLKKERKKQGSLSALLSLKFKGGPKDFSKNLDKYTYD